MAKKMSLKDLKVSSFMTNLNGGAVSLPEADQIAIDIKTINDPTAMTWCYVCPVKTENCW